MAENKNGFRNSVSCEYQHNSMDLRPRRHAGQFLRHAQYPGAPLKSQNKHTPKSTAGTGNPERVSRFIIVAGASEVVEHSRHPKTDRCLIGGLRRRRRTFCNRSCLTEGGTRNEETTINNLESGTSGWSASPASHLRSGDTEHQRQRARPPARRQCSSTTPAICRPWHTHPLTVS